MRVLGTGEVVVGPDAHVLVLVGGDPEHDRDDRGGKAGGVVGHHVEPSRPSSRPDQLAGPCADQRLELGDPSGRESPGHDLAHLGVVGRIHVDHRARRPRRGLRPPARHPCSTCTWRCRGGRRARRRSARAPRSRGRVVDRPVLLRAATRRSGTDRAGTVIEGIEFHLARRYTGPVACCVWRRRWRAAPSAPCSTTSSSAKGPGGTTGELWFSDMHDHRVVRTRRRPGRRRRHHRRRDHRRRAVGARLAARRSPARRRDGDPAAAAGRARRSSRRARRPLLGGPWVAQRHDRRRRRHRLRRRHGGPHPRARRRAARRPDVPGRARRRAGSARPTTSSRPTATSSPTTAAR